MLVFPQENLENGISRDFVRKKSIFFLSEDAHILMSYYMQYSPKIHKTLASSDEIFFIIFFCEQSKIKVWF